MAIHNLHKIGTLGHALAAAVQELGVGTVATITRRSESGLYAMCAIGEAARNAASLKMGEAADLVAELGRLGRPEFFSAAFAHAYGAAATAPPTQHVLHHIATLSALHGQTCGVLASVFTRAAKRGVPIRLSAAERNEAVTAIDAQVSCLLRLREDLLGTTSIVPLPLPLAA